MLRDHFTDAANAAAAQKFAVVGGGAAFWGGITANHVAAIGGLIVGIIGLAVQLYYRRREDDRQVAKRKEESLQMRRLDERADEIHRLRVNARLARPYEDDVDE